MRQKRAICTEPRSAVCGDTGGVEIKGLGWCGTRTDRAAELAHFYLHVLGLSLVHSEADFWVFELPDGRHVEVFGLSYPGQEHFSTGPVTGFAVSDLPAATEELRQAGIELLGEPGPTWQHFRGPDGNIYELLVDKQIPERPVTSVVLPGGSTVAIVTQRWVLERWDGEADAPELPRIWASKPGFMVGGRRSCAELAVVDRLRREGWDGVWVSAFGGSWLRREWFPAPAYRTLREAGAPEWAVKIFDDLEVANGGKLSGFFDVFAWRAPGDVQFVEVKVGPDRLQGTQRKFLETALRFHRPEQFMIVEIRQAAIQQATS